MNKDVETLLSRGVEETYPAKEEIAKVLETGKKLKLYQGFDPTGDKLHIGHLVGLQKLADWQKAGHQVIFLIGDFTGMIGDPSGKTEARKMLTKETVLANAEEYKAQAGRVLNFAGENPVEIKYNSEWLGKLSAIEFLQIAGSLSVQQIVKRDLFQTRIDAGQDLYMNEFLYPIMQAYDSVAMDVDLEIGGSDQMFNMMMGRKLVKQRLNKEKFVITTPLLTDSSGKKIGKSEGNVIGLTDEPSDLYGKIMSLPDDVIVKCFETITRIPMERVREIATALEAGENPIIYKKLLAFQIVSDLNSPEAAEKARENFESTFSKGGVPEDVKTVTVGQETPLVDILLAEGLVASKTEFTRLTKDGAINEIEPGIYRIGKHRFIKIVRG
jgi:tyrosyl-tRNA synthetase